MTDELYVVFKYIISVCRNPLDDYSARLSRLKKKNRGLIYLSRFGVFGLILYCFFKSFRRSTLVLYQGSVIDDHASGVIRGSLERSGCHDILSEKNKIRISVMYALYGFIFLIRSVVKGYRMAETRNAVEFARCAMISRLAMNYCYLFKKRNIKNVLIAGTNDHRRLAFAILANKYNIPVHVFSVVKTTAVEPSPFKVETYFCWTGEQMESLKSRTGADVILLQSESIKEMKIPVRSNNTRAGLLLNAKFKEDDIRQFITVLKEKYSIENIHIRPHPGKESFKIVFEDAVVKDFREPLKEYLVSVDFVFAPNTNAMVESLINGVPVVYVQFLGEGVFDMHGMVRKNLVLPFDDNFIFPDSINNFYSSDKTQKALDAFYSGYKQTDNAEEKKIRYILNESIN